jgi:SAM-dependent methyltransferase
VVSTPSIAHLKASVPSRYKLAARSAYLRMAAVTTTGSKHECPCCGRLLGRFARFHGEQDQCPGCGSLMRHRALLLYLRDVLHVERARLRLLQVAPNAGVMRWLKARPGVDVVSVDLCSPLASIQADITDMPFEDEAFDMVICSHVLEHVPDDRKAISELFRSLRRGGKAILQVPPSDLEETFEDPSITDPRERQRLFQQYDHVRLCGADYADRIGEAGFEVTTVDYPATLEPRLRDWFGLRIGEPFYLAVRP